MCFIERLKRSERLWNLEGVWVAALQAAGGCEKWNLKKSPVSLTTVSALNLLLYCSSYILEVLLEMLLIAFGASAGVSK